MTHNPFLEPSNPPVASPLSKQAAFQKLSIFLAGKSSGFAAAATMLIAGKQAFGKSAALGFPSLPSGQSQGAFG